MQRIVSKFILFLVFLIVVSVSIPGQPVLADNFGDYTYTNHGDGTATILDYNGTATDVNIPGTLNGLTVIGIGTDAFRSNGLTSVTIPDSVRTIGTQAFLYNNLTSVTIPSSVKTIELNAFRESGLTSVTILDGVTTIGESAFALNNLSSVTIPGSVTLIGQVAFRSNLLTSVTILEGVTTIGAQAFMNNNLTSVTLPSSLTSIGDSAFLNNSLTSVAIPDSSMTIRAAAFQSNALTSITIPDSITEIGEYAFSNNQLSNVTINGGDTIIGAHAFEDNQSPPTDLTIYSYDSSLAKVYAANNGHTFYGFTDLTGLALSAGTLNPAFASGTVSYTASVANNVNSIEVTPTTAVGASTVTVNGETVTSGSASDPIALNVGTNTITVVVTAQDSSTKTYTVEVTRAASSNANLSNLTLSAGSLTPAFASGTEDYTAAVANSVSTIEVTPTTAVGTSTVMVNGETVTSGSASDPITLNVGANTITVVVTAQDSSTKTYTVEVMRAASSNADLSSLTLSEGSLNPAFASGTEDYTAAVANSVSTIEVTPTTAVGTSTVMVNGDTVVSGSASAPIALNVGTNTITVVVTAEDSSTKTYTIDVTRAASSNANLSDLTLSEGSLDPVFASGTEAYTAAVANSVNTIQVTPTTAVGTSTMTVNGDTVTSGSASEPIALNVGTNTITVVVTAQDSSTKTYTIEVTRAASSNADLSDLTLSEGSLDPAFASGTEGYTAAVANSVNTIEVTPTVDVGTSTVTVNGDTVTSGSASEPIALNVGANTITVVVTAQDSSTKTSVEVTRAASSNANLSDLTLSEGSLDPVFASGTEAYTAAVANSVNMIEVTPTTAAGTSSVTVNGDTVVSGSASDPITLNVGANTITVVVTAEDSSTKTYTIDVTRAASSNANLSDLTLSEGSLDPVFASGTEAYTAAVANSVNTIEVTPTVDAGTSTVTVNGNTVTSGSASDPIALNVGANTITVQVTARQLDEDLHD
ncbi:cadherin-like beta sandwich domain-containing protein [Paenibacillus sp. HB172176]|uniref:cadherin-like beta sandwich domain-containing protein n=1 Tax=Paenibacillus sp. HB172176 TaxID=2493690 RepID=UPI0014389875|nr:cadherin-like beta sandwich domain-containing protein [Paenibacillus sp. HB172176]